MYKLSLVLKNVWLKHYLIAQMKARWQRVSSLTSEIFFQWWLQESGVEKQVHLTYQDILAAAYSKSVNLATNGYSSIVMK